MSFGKTDRPGIAGAYLHIPFCFHKCHYCDFYSIVDNQDRQAAFTDRLIEELQAIGELINEPVETRFVGGGTPTLLRPELWQRLLPAVRRYLPLREGGEFTVEANPETVTPELASILMAGGVNRVSVGCQSFNPGHLKTLERWHDPANVRRSVDILRAAGITNLNLDLIFAVPGQSLEDWLADLDRALELEPSHLSCYGLVYEPNTPLTVKMKAGRITPAEQDLEAAMYEATIDRLNAAGFEHYEISNWARRSAEGRASARCRHNMIYWTNRNWWAIGPSASGHVNGLRWKNVPRLGEYLDHGPLPPVMDVERFDAATVAGEQFMLGLRLMEGLHVVEVERLLQLSADLQSPRREAIERHVRHGLLERRDDHLRLSRPGLMLANTVLEDLI